MKLSESDFERLLKQHFDSMYGEESEAIFKEILNLVLEFSGDDSGGAVRLWDQGHAILITYGDSIQQEGEPPLQTLSRFLDSHIKDALNSLHILPFFPYTSDDGFGVQDYTRVNPELGDWEDIKSLAQGRQLMADLVINHCSASHAWFQQFREGVAPGKDYFIEKSSDFDAGRVVRPRSTPLFSPVQVQGETREVWTTFGPDQVDLDFRNPEVLREFVEIILLYLKQGVNVLRLDAVGFLWKESGHSCIHHELTHEAIKLIRLIFDFLGGARWLITETNVPNRENLSYFGNRNEAHMIYNFSLPPLLLNALITGSATHLNSWMMSMPPAPANCAYLNFTASHDGIGLRPAEGLLEGQEMEVLLSTMQKFGGRISMRAAQDGRQVPYEINISLYEALKGTAAGEDEYQLERFLCAQAIMMALEGVPAFYIHSLLATPNDLKGVEESGMNRRINRHKWDYPELEGLLADESSPQSRALKGVTELIRLRAVQGAFHPNATQFTLQLGPELFAFWRQSMDRSQSIFVINNVSNQEVKLKFSELNLISTDDWLDLISGNQIQDNYGEMKLKPYQVIWLTNR